MYCDNCPPGCRLCWMDDDTDDEIEEETDMDDDSADEPYDPLREI